ncbi:hypothetical protein [Metabacillus rhizosphaerae]|uniref:hypothetical protein n=1 Tax=Metabacillus rhizosphaerae TaxID=3117747 RepID=UPI0039B768C1
MVKPEQGNYKIYQFYKLNNKTDPNFPTLTSLTPEEPAAFEMAIHYGKQIDADIIMETDPDADRLE